ncbi:unnamed protein product [Ectocarpus sp. 4 AP-2014]
MNKFVNLRRGKDKKQLRPEWGQALEDLLPEYRALFQPLQTTVHPKPPPNETAKKTKTTRKYSSKSTMEKQLSGREDFLYDVKAKIRDVLQIEAKLRKSDFGLRERRGDIWSEINERQPSIKPSATKEWIF